MDAEIRDLPAHMRDFGLHLLGRSVRDVTFSETLLPYSHAMAICTAAQSAEILIKARIAEEHPLLIFSKLPRAIEGKTDRLSVSDLLNLAKSIQFNDLPDMLWATTGYRIANREQFQHFGDTRNAIMHFAVPDVDLSGLTIQFAIAIMQPMIFEFWQESLMTYCGRYDDDMDTYLKEQLDLCGLPMPPVTRMQL